jgi:arginine/serine-rich splicing factor 4/5/6
MAAKIRPVYCGNFEYDARQSEIERLFKEYGRVDRVDMKTGKLLLFLWSLSNGSIHVNPASDN